MSIDKDLITKSRSAMIKYLPEILTMEGLILTVTDAIIGPRIVALRLKGYSDEEILKLLIEEP